MGGKKHGREEREPPGYGGGHLGISLCKYQESYLLRTRIAVVMDAH